MVILAPQSASGASGWLWPVEGQVITPYRNDNTKPYSGGMHRGIDIAAAVGSRVVASRSGVVSYAGVSGSSGRTVSIKDGGGRYLQTYLHLERIDVVRGAPVAAGDPVGTVGTTGVRSAEQPHLHFGVRDVDRSDFYYDPLQFLESPRVAMTTPLPKEAVKTSSSAMAAVSIGGAVSSKTPTTRPDRDNARAGRHKLRTRVRSNLGPVRRELPVARPSRARSESTGRRGVRTKSRKVGFTTPHLSSAASKSPSTQAVAGGQRPVAPSGKGRAWVWLIFLAVFAVALVAALALWLRGRGQRDSARFSTEVPLKEPACKPVQPRARISKGLSARRTTTSSV